MSKLISFPITEQQGYSTAQQLQCPFLQGVFYIRNATPDFSKFPPHLPRGSYRMDCNYTYYSSLLFALEFYGKIKDKPIDWEKIPKHNWR
ncbi:hypothetical protein ILUMI_04969 [Ignelater luminosus]|uniref:Uncharacterized protein n=1 Tax=Ignelater luminosus TaxID=2038154 RepID=A0A8K0DDF9_IGNLU|nr:hypothetical protein ILUMI_04969 [Ignelater luminosus]